MNKGGKYTRKIDYRSKKSMVDFLTGHFRYDTMNSWNQATSYAHNVKIHRLGLTTEQEDKVFEMSECEDFYFSINSLINAFNYKHDFIYQAGFNGRSDGYIVLRQGGCKVKHIFTDSEFEADSANYHGRTYADGYGWKSKEEAIEAGVYNKQIKTVFSQPGRGLDMYEDFEEWDIDSLRDRCKLIQEFDDLVENILETVKAMLEEYQIEEEEYQVTKTRKVLKAA